MIYKYLIFIIKKNSKKTNYPKFLNPNDDNDILVKKSNFYFSKKTKEMFPIIDGIIIYNKNEIFINH